METGEQYQVTVLLSGTNTIVGCGDFTELSF
jgi:hypothetical protein